jgi:hypothetical protein
VPPVAPSPRDGSEPAVSVSAALGLGGSGDAARLAMFDAMFGQSPIGGAIFDAECRYVLVTTLWRR